MMQHRKPGQALLLSLTIILSSPSAAYAEIYRWVDENGKVQYGDAPPALDNTTTEFDYRGNKTRPAGTPSTSAAYVDPRVQALNQAKREQMLSEADAALLSSFSNEQDILYARDKRLSTLEQSIRFNQHSIEQWQSMRSVLDQGNSNGSAAEIEQKRQQLSTWIQEAKRNIRLIEKEKQETADTFSRHIERFQRLSQNQ